MNQSTVVMSVESQQRLKGRNRALGLCLCATMILLFGAAFFKAKQRWNEAPVTPTPVASAHVSK